ncbi:alpha/beta fold hydrolase [Hymenobacter sp. DG25A]|uniref:alpha/beta fold hydrolase n=1 Tax=Hymenobacter sp. DG25A TaxID=1385663 RepID=UPI0006BDA790|nr:alpha/beta fold hydrolase [Hymenobacter sp. DG25A]ALD20681.1 alpha/beta hydrolase [Hymenobacter sp. DG25A]
MHIQSRSSFKDESADRSYFENWVDRLEAHNGRKYERYALETALGTTHVWGLHTNEDLADALVIFPGARTTSLIWDFDRGLDNLRHRMKIFLVETNGLPNLSSGATPNIKSLDYGTWAAEVMRKLGLAKAYVAGASFGGLICMKLGITNPEMIQSAFLLNPGCLQPFSISPKNLYYNILPLVSPSSRNVSTFLDRAIFAKPTHQLSAFSEQMLIDYEVFAISRYQDKTQKPYYMKQQLDEVKAETYLLLGDKDLLFPTKNSFENGKKHLKYLRETVVFPNVGHGIETYAQAMHFIGDKIKANSPRN